MVSRNIAVRKDVYEALRREQRPGESFSKLLLRLLHQRAPLVELVGSWDSRLKGSASEGRRLRQLRAGSSGGRS